MELRKLGKSEMDAAAALVEAVFMQFEAPDYSEQGVSTFKNTALYNPGYMNSLTVYGAYDGAALAGVIATRNKGNHIALFFVEGTRHRQGIGRLLFQKALENSTADEITVNSSPYAAEVYRRLGFADTAEEQNADGMRYIPMKYRK